MNREKKVEIGNEGTTEELLPWGWASRPENFQAIKKRKEDFARIGGIIP
jgi:hypothetical protein